MRVDNLPISNVIDIVQYKCFGWKRLMLCFLFAWSDPSSKFIKCFLVNSISFNFEPICFQKRLLHFELLAIATTYFPFLILTREHFSIFACRFQLISQIYYRLAIVTNKSSYASQKQKKADAKMRFFVLPKSYFWNCPLFWIGIRFHKQRIWFSSFQIMCVCWYLLCDTVMFIWTRNWIEIPKSWYTFSRNAYKHFHFVFTCYTILTQIFIKY